MNVDLSVYGYFINGVGGRVHMNVCVCGWVGVNDEIKMGNPTLPNPPPLFSTGLQQGGGLVGFGSAGVRNGSGLPSLLR